MNDWISLFEKYKIDRRLLTSYRRELRTLDESSSRHNALATVIEQLEQKLRYLEELLSAYDHAPASAREAVKRSEERLFLTYHYVRGMTMEETAEEMKISRDTVYRIRRRILSRSDAPDAYPEREWAPLLFPLPDESAPSYSPTEVQPANSRQSDRAGGFPNTHGSV